MRQNLFLGWGLLWVMLFTFHSCSNEMDSDSESDEEAVNLRLSADSVLTRGKPWDEETPMEWAETVEGTGRFMPGYIYYFYLDKKPESKNDEDAGYYAFFDWGAGFGADGIGDEVAQEYYMQIQWSHTEYSPEWHYINMADNKYGLVKILRSELLDDLPAYAFPYKVNGETIYVRMRTIHKDFITSSPVPEVESQYRYDRSLYSSWSYPSYAGEYCNYWGCGRPQPDPESEESGDEEEEIQKCTILVIVYLPYEIGYPKKYTYTYEIMNMTGGYVQYLTGAPNAVGFSKSIADVVGEKGGSMEVFATRRDNLTNEDSYSSQMINYDTGEREIEVYFTVSDFER